MVDGLKINPSVPGAGSAKDAESYGGPNKIKQKTALYKTENIFRTPGSGAEKESKLSAAITRAAGEKTRALNADSTKDFLKAAEEIINASLPQDPPDTRLRIDKDDATGVFIYQGIDKDSGEVVHQWPADEVLKFLAHHREQEGAEGIVVDVET
ncbi:flagellar protein FlaG [Emcibacter sp.]|uniref:flagellar protein FlaG n=1 Tax=Emcibacter sp. TaxID=1979954 RepID=UPI003A935917